MQDTDLMLHTLLELGESMLADGADVRRVEQTLSRMGKAYGAVRMDVFVITSSIVLTMCFADGSAATQTRRIEKTADLFDEAIIATAAADCALRSERWILDLESGIRIVVEPAHELRVNGVGDSNSCEVGFQSFELLVATLAEIVRDDRRTDSRCFAALFLAVEKTKRILVKSGLAVFTELALLGFEEFDELLSVLRTAVRIADGVQMEIKIFQSELMENLTSHRDDFRIRKRRGRTEDFQTELVEFTVTAGLRTVIAEHGADVEHLMHLLVSIHFMF